MKPRKLQDRFMTSIVYTAGIGVILLVFALFYYLGNESKYAFQQGFGYGYRFALGPDEVESDYAVEFDATATLLASNAEGEDGLDEKEEDILMPDLATLDGFSAFATGTPLTGEIAKVDATQLYRDDWRSLKPAERGDRFLLFAFATAEHSGKTMTLRWEPDASYLPKFAPYDISLRLVRAPDGIETRAIEVDLMKSPQGAVQLPTFIARTDEDRTKGYVFAMEVKPKTSTFFATVTNFFSTDWAPTLVYPRFGFMPLLLGTLSMVGIAMLVAIPISACLALFLSELAPRRLREWLKPIIELLSSVPTVVLGFFGVILLAPVLQRWMGEVFVVESGRMLLSAAIVLGILLVPTIATVAEDALRNIPNSLRDGGDAIGLTRRETLKKVVLPAARAGFIAALLLGLARGIGETMIIWMLSGGTARMPALGSLHATGENLVKPTSGMPDRIGIEMGNVAFESVHYGHLFLLGLVLYLMTLAINLYGFQLARRSAWQG
jgi:phosphate transport system permease protein